jgi:hypothetical protein
MLFGVLALVEGLDPELLDLLQVRALPRSPGRGAP